MQARHTSTAGRGQVEVTDIAPRRLRHLCRTVIALGLSALTVLPVCEPVRAQDLPAQPASPSAAEPTAAAQVAAAPAEFTAGSPHVHTVAQGLIGVEGPQVWRVREVGLSATGAPESGATSFSLQRTGAAIIRNELTSRRTRLEAGEAYFMS